MMNFFSNQVERRQAKLAGAKQVEALTDAYIEEHAEQIRQQAQAAGLNSEKTDEFLIAVKEELREKAVNRFLEKAREIDKELESEPIGKRYNP